MTILVCTDSIISKGTELTDAVALLRNQNSRSMTLWFDGFCELTRNPAASPSSTTATSK